MKRLLSQHPFREQVRHTVLCHVPEGLPDSLPGYLTHYFFKTLECSNVLKLDNFEPSHILAFVRSTDSSAWI